MHNSNSCTLRDPNIPRNKSNNHNGGNKNKNKNENKNENNNEQARIYFPSISIQVLQDVLHGTANSGKKQNQNKTQLDKYLYSENQKTTMYGTTCILEIQNNQPYTIYPCDKMILTSSISAPIASSGSGSGSKQHQHQRQHIPLLVDYSNMKRSQTPAYQIPYEFKVNTRLVRKYKMNPMSTTSFVIEYKDNKVYNFYILANLSRIPSGILANQIEIDNFIKEDIISFLLTLNLY
jgi:hypothetical protein